MTVVPGSVAYPPELSYPDPSHTREPAVVLREKGKSRLIYFPGDVDRTLWHSGHTDLSRLLRNSIRWVAGQEQPITIEGEGLIEPFAWETEAGYAVHVLNYTNPAVHRGWIREFYPIGEQHVRMRLPEGRECRGWNCCGPQRKSHSKSQMAPSLSPYPKSLTTRWRQCFHLDGARRAIPTTSHGAAAGSGAELRNS